MKIIITHSQLNTPQSIDTTLIVYATNKYLLTITITSRYFNSYF